MKRNVLLGIWNVALSLGFFILFFLRFSSNAFNSVPDFFELYALNMLLLGLSIVNAVMAYKLLLKRHKPKSYRLFTLVTFIPLIWFAMFFIGFFFSSQLLLPVILIGVAAGLFQFAKPLSQKFALALAATTLIISFAAFFASFEENYCWLKGEEAYEYGDEMIIATKKDAELLQTYGVKEGNKVGGSFKVHMLCHKNFNMISALKETYLGL